MPHELPTPARVVSMHPETASVRTFALDCAIEASPGQFIMAWLPGIGEKPLSLVDCRPLTLTVANVGRFSAGMHALRAGDRVWIRGPYGRGFSLQEESALLVAGGYGAAPLAFLARRATAAGMRVTAALGARTASELVFADRLSAMGCDVQVSTDDGSAGSPGLVTDLALRLIERQRPDTLYACGPEGMMRRVIELAVETGLPCQVSMERVMKCGFGVCGSCDMDGRLVCTDGPVFTADELRHKPWDCECRCATGPDR